MRATASPAAALLPPAPPGQTSTRTVAVTDPGTVPIALGRREHHRPRGRRPVGGEQRMRGHGARAARDLLGVGALRPAAAGEAAGELQVSSDDGSLYVPLSAVAPSLSGLRSRQLAHPQFVPTGAGDGVGYRQRWRSHPHQPVARGRVDRPGDAVGRRRAALSHRVGPLRPRHPARARGLPAPGDVHPDPPRHRARPAHPPGHRVPAHRTAAPGGVRAARGDAADRRRSPRLLRDPRRAWCRPRSASPRPCTGP